MAIVSLLIPCNVPIYQIKIIAAVVQNSIQGSCYRKRYRCRENMPVLRLKVLFYILQQHED
ncbi:hypothetical protein T09_3912 [Trichinella sp. T9]|nr:hypothetical protein T09_3912 [Trichinella sp. T9]